MTSTTDKMEDHRKYVEALEPVFQGHVNRNLGTLREGEQFANAFFTTENKIKIATMLSEFGVDYIELTSPVSSPQSYEDCKTICKLGLKVSICCLAVCLRLMTNAFQ